MRNSLLLLGVGVPKICLTVFHGCVNKCKQNVNVN